MSYPQLYIGQVPGSASERYVLRERALDLHAALRGGSRPRAEQEPTLLLLNFLIGDRSVPQPVELLLLRPNAAIVALVRSYSGPIEVTPDGRWTDLASGAALRDGLGRTPLQVVRAQRDAVRACLQRSAATLLEPALDTGPALVRGAMELPSAVDRPFERTVGAFICAPATHPESRISLDVDDHRQWLKILGLDELAGLAAMLRSGARLSETALHTIAAELFGGRLWHDGEKLLFELVPGRFQLRLLGEGPPEAAILPLIEGENVIGRRKSTRHHEHRVTLSGDDLVSSDHARLVCGDEQITLRDISKNGTYLLQPDGSEEPLRGADRILVPGALLRMGVTRLRLERAGD
jgi:hypothetical protein